MDELREAFEQAYEKNTIEEAQETTEGMEESGTEEASTSEVLENEAVNEQDAQEPRQEEEQKAGEGEGQEQQEQRDLQEKDGDNVSKNKPPSSWSPKARESWGKLSQDAQQQITKREKEVNQVLQDSAQARHFATEFNNLISPHRESLIASGASNPLQAVQNLLQAESQLRLGSSQQRAVAAAKMISDYGIDINALDSALSGQPMNSGQQGGGNFSDFESLLDQRLAPVNQFLQNQQQQEEQRQIEVRTNAQNSVTEFSQSAEFLNDVRGDMADLLDLASSRGQVMSLQQAYDKACAIHPEISEIIQGRQTQQKIMGNNTNIQNKRNAASSITGRQGGAGGSKQAVTMRGQLEDAWNDFSR